MLAKEFVRLGHDVTVVTQTSTLLNLTFPFPVIRRPGILSLLKWYRWADTVFVNNVSLRLLWPTFCFKHPCYVTTQTWLSGVHGTSSLMARVKRFLLKRVLNIAISNAVAKHLQLPCIVLGNPYDPATFHMADGEKRPGSLLFVGRIVSDKGLDLLLQALDEFRKCGKGLSLTVVGDGPDRANAVTMTEALSLGEHVNFVGSLHGANLSSVMRAHEFLVVPSRWPEPFGIVALEGIACGCIALGTELGGLPEAIGPCGITVPNGSASALARGLRWLTENSHSRQSFRNAAYEHLKRFEVTEITRQYLSLFDSRSPVRGDFSDSNSTKCGR